MSKLIKLYQYLNHIRADLVAYDIGSVQPSIKVTHIKKHPIYVPSDERLQSFSVIAENTTNIIYNNYQKNTVLQTTRDNLLPKLMSGELDVSDIDIA